MLVEENPSTGSLPLPKDNPLDTKAKAKKNLLTQFIRPTLIVLAILILTPLLITPLAIVVPIDNINANLIYGIILSSIFFFLFLYLAVRVQVNKLSVIVAFFITLFFIIVLNAILFITFYLQISGSHLSISEGLKIFVEGSIFRYTQLPFLYGIPFFLLNAGLLHSKDLAKKVLRFAISALIALTLAQVLFTIFVFVFSSLFLSHSAIPEAGIGFIIFPATISVLFGPPVFCFFLVSAPLLLGSLILKNARLPKLLFFTMLIFIGSLIIQSGVLMSIAKASTVEANIKLKYKSDKISLNKHQSILPTYLPPYTSISSTHDSGDEHGIYLKCDYPGAYTYGFSIAESTSITGSLKGDEKFLQKPFGSTERNHFIVYPVVINSEKGFITAESLASRHYDMYWTHQGRLFSMPDVPDVCFYDKVKSDTQDIYAEKDKYIVSELIKIAESIK